MNRRFSRATAWQKGESYGRHPVAYRPRFEWWQSPRSWRPESHCMHCAATDWNRPIERDNRIIPGAGACPLPSTTMDVLRIITCHLNRACPIADQSRRRAVLTPARRSCVFSQAGTAVGSRRPRPADLAQGLGAGKLRVPGCFRLSEDLPGFRPQYLVRGLSRDEKYGAGARLRNIIAISRGRESTCGGIVTLAGRSLPTGEACLKPREWQAILGSITRSEWVPGSAREPAESNRNPGFPSSGAPETS